MFEKYISVKDNKIVAKQTAAGVWYIAELPADTTAELKLLIGECNKILNEYNKKETGKNGKKD